MSNLDKKSINKTKDYSSSLIPELASSWRAILTDVFSKKYRPARISFTFMFAIYFLMAPIQPLRPEKGELYVIAGESRFQHINTLRGSATYFFVNDELIHCSFTGLGGANACDSFAGRFDVSRPVKVNFFWMKNRSFIPAKILDSLEQDGRLIISPNDSWRLRKSFFEVEKKWSWVVPSIFGFMTLFFFLLGFCTSSRRAQ